MRVFPHHLPHQSAAIILHHREDRSLIDAEIVVRDPTVDGVDRARFRPEIGKGEARVERVLETIARIKPGPILRAHRHQRGDRYLGRKGDRRSEEHTSELQALMRTSYAVFCLKKKK